MQQQVVLLIIILNEERMTAARARVCGFVCVADFEWLSTLLQSVAIHAVSCLLLWL